MKRNERTKVVATLGPACREPRVLGAMLGEGVDVVRVNFSHGTPEEHVEGIRMVRRVAAQLERNVAVLADLQGPKIRVGEVGSEGVRLATGGSCELVAGAERAPAPAIPVPYEHLAADVRAGDRVLIDDGAIELAVAGVEGDRVRCEVRCGGLVRSRKGVNLPGVAVSATALTAKDREDLAIAVAEGVDYLALSFVRRPEDVEEAREAVARLGGGVPVIAKLERPEAIERLDDVLAVSDAVMVARGDLGVEMAVEQVPPLQKEVIARANAVGVPVVTATQMLESMVSAPSPTRAEASDVANAIFDGSDAVMLSGETAIGSYPVEAVAMMQRIASAAEASAHLQHVPPAPGVGTLGVVASVCKAAVQAAEDVEARALVAFTDSGLTARLVSRFRPRIPTVGMTPHEATRRRMALYWGVDAPPALPRGTDLSGMVAEADRRLLDAGRAGRGDLVVVVAGVPGGQGGTNRVIVHRVGEPEPTGPV